MQIVAWRRRRRPRAPGRRDNLARPGSQLRGPADGTPQGGSAGGHHGRCHSGSGCRSLPQRRSGRDPGGCRPRGPPGRSPVLPRGGCARPDVKKRAPTQRLRPQGPGPKGPLGWEAGSCVAVDGTEQQFAGHCAALALLEQRGPRYRVRAGLRSPSARRHVNATAAGRVQMNRSRCLIRRTPATGRQLPCRQDAQFGPEPGDVSCPGRSVIRRATAMITLIPCCSIYPNYWAHLTEWTN